jgi:hypothetical protein
MGANYDSDQKAKQAKLDKDVAYQRARDIGDMQKLLHMPEFRRFCWRKMSEAGIFLTSFTQNAMTTAYSEGKRITGLGLLSDLNDADPNAFAQIQREYISEQKSKEAADKKEEEENAKPN